MRKLSIFIISILWFSFAFSQGTVPKMVFEIDNHDFGKINEQDGLASFQFNFTNTSSEPIIISEVKASCGCTTPEWSKQPIAPGAKGFVITKYNPLGRPGSFSKTITVTSNCENSPTVLKISGEVIPKPKTVEEEYPFNIDKVRMKSGSVNFGEILNNAKRSEEVNIVNTSDKDITITLNPKVKFPHLTLKSVPATLKAGEKGKLVFSYDAAKKQDWDFVSDQINLDINGAANENNRFLVTATIIEKFDDNTVKNPPIMDFSGSASEFDFGTIKEGETNEHVFKFKNTGKSDLIIRKINSTCGCTVANTKKKVIKPGTEGSIKVVFNSTGKGGDNNRIITVTTNIPGKTNNVNNSRVLLIMKGKVTPK